METIEYVIKENAMYISWCALSITLDRTIMISTNKRRKRRYVEWKKDVFSLPFFKREFERNDDVLLNELFSENERLSKENKCSTSK